MQVSRCIGVYRGHVSALFPVYLVAYPFSVLAAEIPGPLCGGVCSREPFEIEREGVSRGLREFGGVSGCLSVFDRLEGHGLGSEPVVVEVELECFYRETGWSISRFPYRG